MRGKNALPTERRMISRNSPTFCRDFTIRDSTVNRLIDCEWILIAIAMQISSVREMSFFQRRKCARRSRFSDRFQELQDLDLTKRGRSLEIPMPISHAFDKRYKAFKRGNFGTFTPLTKCGN